MTNRKLRESVDLAVQIDRQIADLTEQLKELKSSLIEEARSRPEELTPSAKGDGKTIAFEGHDGCIARVSFPKPTLKSSIRDDSTVIETIRTISGDLFRKLFSPARSWKPVPEFRFVARDRLDPKDAARLIRLCQSKTSPRVSFETRHAEDRV